VLGRFQGIREQFAGDPWLHFCNGYFEVYIFFKLNKYFAKNNLVTSLSGDMLFA
jgi:hypothetical protein